MISGFRHGVFKVFVLLSCYTALVGSFYSPLDMWLMRYPKTWIKKLPTIAA
jgi:hypothetical protein